MPLFQEYGTFALAGWVLFFFAAAVGSGNFPGILPLDPFYLYTLIVSLIHNL